MAMKSHKILKFCLCAPNSPYLRTLAMVSVAHNLGPVFLLGFQVSAMSWPLCKSIPLKNTEISGGTWMSLSSKKKEIENNQTFYTEKGLPP